MEALTISEAPGNENAKPRILIGVVGGVVQWVLSEVPVEYMIVDYDTETAEPQELNSIPPIDETDLETNAYVVTDDAEVNAERVNQVFEAVEEQDA